MIDFKITFQVHELFYEDQKKMSLILKIMFGKILRQFKSRTELPPYQSLNTQCCHRNLSAIMDLIF